MGVAMQVSYALAVAAYSLSSSLATAETDLVHRHRRLDAPLNVPEPNDCLDVQFLSRNIPSLTALPSMCVPLPEDMIAVSEETETAIHLRERDFSHTFSLTTSQGTLHLDLNDAFSNGVRVIGVVDYDSRDTEMKSSDLQLEGRIDMLKNVIPLIQFCAPSTTTIATVATISAKLVDIRGCDAVAQSDLEVTVDIPRSVGNLAPLLSTARIQDHANVSVTSPILFSPGDIERVVARVQVYSDRPEDKILVGMEDPHGLLDREGKFDANGITIVFPMGASDELRFLCASCESPNTCVDIRSARLTKNMSPAEVKRELIELLSVCKGQEPRSNEEPHVFLHRNGSWVEWQVFGLAPDVVLNLQLDSEASGSGIVLRKQVMIHSELVVSGEATHIAQLLQSLTVSAHETTRSFEVTLECELSPSDDEATGERLRSVVEIEVIANTRNLQLVASSPTTTTLLRGKSSARLNRVTIVDGRRVMDTEVTRCLDHGELQLRATATSHSLLLHSGTREQERVIDVVAGAEASVPPSTVAATGTVCDIQEFLKRIEASPLAMSAFRVYREDQQFELRRFPPQLGASTDHMRYTVTFDAAAALGGTFVLGVTVPDGFNRNIEQEISGVRCESSPIQPSDTVQAIEDALLAMPCSASPGGTPLLRSAVHVLQVISVVPSTPLSLLSQVTIQLTSTGQATIITAGSTASTVEAAVRAVTGDTAVVVSSTAINDTALEWRVTFSTNGAQELVGMLVPSDSPLRVNSLVVQEGIAAADLSLSLFYPRLASSVRRTKASDTSALEIMMWNVPSSEGGPFRSPPTLSVRDSTVHDATSGATVALHLRNASVAAVTEEEFRLAILDKLSGPLNFASLTAKTLQEAIEELQVHGLEAVNVSGTAEDKLTIEASHPERLTMRAVRDQAPVTAHSAISITKVNYGTLVYAVKDTIDVSLVDIAAATTVSSVTTSVRFRWPVNKPQLHLKQMRYQVRDGDTLDIHGLDIDGDDELPVLMTAQASHGTVSDRGGDLLGKPTTVAQLKRRLISSLLFYSVDRNATDTVHAVITLTILCTGSEWSDVSTTATIAVAINPKIDQIPVFVDAPVQTVRVHNAVPTQLPGVNVKLRNGPTLSHHHRGLYHVRLESERKAGGTLNLEKTLSSFMGEFVSESRSALVITGSLARVNVALGGVIYTPPRRGAEDTIRMRVSLLSDSGSIQPTQSVEHKFIVLIVHEPDRVDVHWQNQAIDALSVVYVKEDEQLRLSDLSLNLNNDPSDDSTLLTVTLKVQHGAFMETDNSTSEGANAPDKRPSLTITDTARAICQTLGGLAYLPNHNYNGPDLIEVIASVAAQASLVPTRASLAVFVQPVDDEIRVEWLDADSATTRMTLSQCCGREVARHIPRLIIVDDDDDTDAESFFRPRHVLHVEVQVPQDSPVAVYHEDVGDHDVVTANGSATRLVFDGRASDVMSLLEGVRVFPTLGTPSSGEHSTNVTVRVTKRGGSSAAELEPVQVQLVVDVKVADEGLDFAALFPPALQRIDTIEDHSLALVDALAWADLEDETSFKVQQITVEVTHGTLENQVANGLERMRSWLIPVTSARQLKQFVNQLVYVPEEDYTGYDSLRIGTEARSIIVGISIQSVNDPPTLTLIGSAKERSVQHYVPALRVRDRDNGEILELQVSVEGNASLVVEPDKFQGIRLWLQDGATNSTIALESTETKRLRVRGREDAINHAFESTKAFEVSVLLIPVRQTASLLICVTDSMEQSECQSQVIEFPATSELLTIHAMSLQLEWMIAVPLAELLEVNTFEVDEKTPVELRLSSHHGSFSTSAAADSEVACGSSREWFSESRSGSGIVRVLSGPVSCVSALANRTMFRVNSRPAILAKASDSIAVDLIVHGILRVHQQINYEVLLPKPRYRVALESKVASHEKMWEWERGDRTPLQDIADLVVVYELDADTGEEVLLALNVTCESCLLSYDDTNEPLVPSVVYLDGIIEPSPGLHFYGNRDSLSRLLRTLQIEALPSSTSGEGAVKFRVAEAGEWLEAAIGSTRIPFKFNVTSSPQLHWIIKRSHYRSTGQPGIASVDGVTLVTRNVDGDSTDVFLSIICSEAVLVSVDHSSARVVDKPCGGESGSLTVSVSVALVNAVLRSLNVRLPAANASSIPVTDAVTLSLTARMRTVVSTTVDINVAFNGPATRRLGVVSMIQPVNRTVEIMEDERTILGDVFVATANGDGDLYRLTAKVTHGALGLSDLSKVCCVHVMKSHMLEEMSLEGTLSALATALTRVEYTPEPESSGEERLTLSILEEDDSGVYVRRWTHDVIISIEPLNDAPVITFKKFLPRLVTRHSLQANEGDLQDFIETDLSITITDVDLTEKRATTPPLSSLVRVAFNATGPHSYVAIPGWDKFDHGIVVQDVVGPVSQGQLAATSFVFQAPLQSLNALLANVTLVGRHDSRTEDVATYPSLSIEVSDLGHDVSGWSERVAVQVVGTSSLSSADTIDTRKLSLSAESSHSHLDAQSRVLTLTGTQLEQGYDTDDDDLEDEVVVRGIAALRSVPEVQRVQLIGPKHVQLLTVTLEAPANAIVASITGTFQIEITDPATAQARAVTVRAQASAMQVDEITGDEGTGRGLGESMQSRLRVLYGDAVFTKHQVHIIKTQETAGSRTTWQTYVEVRPGDEELPPMRVMATALVVQNGGAASVSVSADRYAGPLGGFFTLKLASEQTRRLAADVNAAELQDALEELAAIQAAKVTAVAPHTFDVMFLLPSSRVPLLEGDASRLTPFQTLADTPWPNVTRIGARILITRRVKGEGQGSTYRVGVGGIQVHPVYQVEATATTATLGGGWFTLAFRQTTDLSDPILAVTDEIALDAVAMTADEGILQQQGGRNGSSMQSQLMRAISKFSKYELSYKGVQVVVTRSTTAMSPPTHKWTITFLHAPATFPLLVVAESSAATAKVSSIVPSNAVGGNFLLAFGGFSTPPLAVDATASHVEDALNRLPSIYNSQAGFGRVVVGRREEPRIRGASYTIYFAEETSELTSSSLTADGSSLTGLGAAAHSVALTKWRLNREDNESSWLLPPFHALAHTSSATWSRGITGAAQPSGFELRGKGGTMRTALLQLGYHVPIDWCGGYVSLILTAKLAADGDQADGVTTQTEEQHVIPSVPTIDVRLHGRNLVDGSQSPRVDAVVERGAQVPIDRLQVDAPSWARGHVWINVLFTVDEGSLTLLNRTQQPTSASAVLWINGTVEMANRELQRLVYSASTATHHRVDVLTSSVLDTDGKLLAQKAWLLQITEPPVTPRISMDVAMYAQFDGEFHLTDKGKPVPLIGFQIEDASGGSRDTNELTLVIEAGIGHLAFAAVDGLSVMRRESSRAVELHGTMIALNRALANLLYSPSERFSHSRDTVTISVECHPPRRPVLRDKQSIRLHITPAIRVPRVLVGNSSAATYATKEDHGYQFPSLELIDDEGGGSTVSIKRTYRQPVVELRRTELTAPTITTLEVTSEENDARHRWIADLPGLMSTSSFTAISSSLFFFTGSSDRHGEELWISDGSSNGTRLVADLVPGSGSGSPSDSALMPSVNKVVFAADGVDSAWTLKSAHSCNGARFSSVQPDLQYVVSASNTWTPSATYDCPELGWHWATTEEGRTRFNQQPPEASHNISESYVFWDTCDWDGYSFGGVVRKHFRFADSATTGAMKHAGRRDSAALETSFATSEFAGIVCVRDAASSTAGGRELWTVDATDQPGQPRRLVDIELGPRGSNPHFLTAYGSTMVLFQATTLARGTELYRTDGTTSGTMLVADLWRGPRSSNPSEFAEWSGGDGRMYFAATTDSGRELWSTDGTASLTIASGVVVGTFQVADICVGDGGSDPRSIAAFGARGVFFSATDCVHGRELWTSDGTIAGTRLVVDLNPTGDSDPADLVVFNGELYFTATTSGKAMGRELFVSDGTVSGTMLLKEIAPGVVSSSPSRLTVANGKLVFHAMDASGVVGNLWTLDGSSAGTTSVWSSGFAHSYGFSRHQPGRLLAIHDSVYYLVQRHARGNGGIGEVAMASLQLEITVSHGAISVHSDLASSTQPQPSLRLNGTRTQVQEVLRRVLFHTPPNWNVLEAAVDHVVQWTFTMSSLTDTQAPTQSTTADLIVRPTLDPPVIIVPLFKNDPIHSAHDYLSLLRVQCLPLTVLEDVPTPLPGFSVRGVDDADGRYVWTLDMSVRRGSIVVTDRHGCVAAVHARRSDRVNLQSSRIACIARLLSTIVYTSGVDTSGDDVLTIRVSSALASEAMRMLTSDSAEVPIVVTEVNDAPYLVSETGSGFFYAANEDEVLVLDDLRVLDPDADPEKDLITIELSVRYGSLALLPAPSAAVTVLRNVTASGFPSASTELVLQGPLHDINAVLSALVYTSARDWNSLMTDAFDVIFIRTSDTQAFNSSTSTELTVDVAPTPDAVVISQPQLPLTSTFTSGEGGALNVIEDTWLEIDALAFASVDDTQRLLLTVTLSVDHGSLAMEPTALAALAKVDGTASEWTLRGGFSNVNAAVSTLRYLPTSDYNGADIFRIQASSVDVYARQESIVSNVVVSIIVHAVNDAPVWTLPSRTIHWTQGQPTRVYGISLADVDCCATCEMEIIVETVGSASVTFPRLVQSLQFSTSSQSAQSTYAILRGPLVQLNIALSELVVTATEADAAVVEPVEIWLTADDLGHSGEGGPQVTRTRLLVTPLDWTSHTLRLFVPDAAVLTTKEDTPLVFADASIRFVDRDASTRPLASAPQYEVELTAHHGHFHLAVEVPSTRMGLLLLPSSSDRVLRVRGFLPQINAALNGSTYLPDENWSGADEIVIVAHQVDAESASTTALIAVFVTPVCDVPRWTPRPAGSDATADIDLVEDSQVLLALPWLAIQDVDTASNLVELTVEVQDSGGVMLLSTRGVEISAYQFPAWTDPAARLTFFSSVILTGSVTTINATVQGLVYRPRPDFHTNNHVRDAIQLTVSSTDAQCGGSSVAVVRAQIYSVSDAPVIMGTPQFKRLARGQDPLANTTDYGAVAMEAYENQPTMLDPVVIKDVDLETTEESEPPGDLRLRISCRSCTVHSSISVDQLQRVHGVLVVAAPPREPSLPWSPSTSYYGPIQKLNEVVLTSLQFTGANQFHGLAVVLLEVSDLGYTDRSDSTFAMVVRVHRVNHPPQIHTPPYGTQDAPLVVDEHGSMLLRGAPLLPQRSSRIISSGEAPTWQLGLVSLAGVDASTRIISLLDVQSFDAERAIGFYASLPQTQQLLFTVFSPATGHELWTTDGSSSGTRLLKDLAPGAASSGPTYLTPFSLDGRVYFGASGVDADAWRLPVDHRDTCDGFRASAVFAGVRFAVTAVATWDVGAQYDCPTGFQWMTTAEAQRLFVRTAATNDPANRADEAEPLVYYGACGWQAYTWGGVARWHFRFADSHVTGAYKHAGQRESYRVDTGMDTTGFAGIVCRQLTEEEQLVGDTRRTLWRTDGTAEGTHRVAAHVSDPQFLTEFGGWLYFQGTVAAFGSELWRSDGSREGTEMVADVAFGAVGSSPQQLTVAIGKLFFTADTPFYGRELWVSDGQVRSDYEQVEHGAEEGTRLVVDIKSGGQGSDPLFLVAVDALGVVLFQADDGVHGAELWRSDGTPHGTSLVIDIYSGAHSSSPRYLTLFGGRVYFQADDGVNGVELWSTGGSAATTAMLVDLVAGAGGSAPRFMSVLSFDSPSLVFAASTDRDVQVVEWWRSDGSAVGTQRVFGDGSRQVARLNERAMAVMHRQQVLRMGADEFVFLGQEVQGVGEAEARTIAVTRSLTLTDDGGAKSYSLSVRADTGAVSIRGGRSGCDVDTAWSEPHRLLELSGTLAYLNCVLTELVYHASGRGVLQVDGGWEDTVTVTLVEELHGGEEEAADGRGYSVTERISVKVAARNHAPIVEVTPRVYSAVDKWTRVPAIHVSDEDAGQDALLFVRIAAASGRVRLVGEWEEVALVVMMAAVDPLGAPVLEFAAPLAQVNQLLTGHLEYACLVQDECVDGMVDTLSVMVDDNGFTGAGGAQVATVTASCVIVKSSS